MSRRRTEAEKALIIADFSQCHSYSIVARKYGLSPTGVKKIVLKETNLVQKFDAKKEEVEQSVIDHIVEQGDKVKLIYDTYIEALLDPDKIDRASPNQLTTALGTLIDKFIVALELNKGKTEEGKENGVIFIPEVKNNE